jgi:hypothetical protein
VEPLNPKVREALKSAHPDLTDKEIDLSEELLARRMLCDPERDADQIAELDSKRMELIERSMPRYAEIARQAMAELASEPQKTKPKFKVEIKAPKPRS